MRRRQIRTLLSLLLVLLAACGGGKQAGTTPGGGNADPLYDRIGGMDAITAIVDDFLANVRADERISAMFANADLENLKSKLVDQICEASGGPCKYTGKNMREAHTGMGVTEAHFNALVEDLVKALAKFKVPEQEQRELLTELGAMKPDIVAPSE